MNSNRSLSDTINRKIIQAIFCAFFITLSTNCSSQTVRFDVTELVIETANGNRVNITAEIAETDEQRQRGLMERDKLDDGKGMIFIFSQDQMVSFWMKDTRIPLSIAFISADGDILEIRAMEPFNLSPVRSSRSVRFALEVPQSWFSRAGIAVGDRLLNSRDLTRRN